MDSKTLKKDILSLKDFQFLKTLAEVVMDSSRIYPRQKIFDKASGRGRYLAIWIRDYTISLETGFMDK